ncbi:MAG: T9SS type A sorting domain-containing protein [Bacteroidia bacterium]|nr:T9SS type A sorting domain-containing protein [Bacteroidia bacterium]MDW8134473.1 T9SS type A sorting domain-containing protein [Bacteroidia bacterium]
MKTLQVVSLLLAGITILGWSQPYSCDTLRVAYGGQWHYDGDTLFTRTGFLTCYPRMQHRSQPGQSLTYTYSWYWWLRGISSQVSNFFSSGSLSGTNPTLSTPLATPSSYPAFYQLWLVVWGYDTLNQVGCSDSILIIIQQDSPLPTSYPCQDSVRLLINAQSVRGYDTITLPLGCYEFNLHYRDIVYEWRMQGPSVPQGQVFSPSLPPTSPVIDTLCLTSPGMHVLSIVQYFAPCLIDTFKYFINAVAPPVWDTCVSPNISPCMPGLTIGNASYLPGAGTISLGTGTYCMHIGLASPPSTPFISNIYWNVCGATLPGGCISGTGSTLCLPVGPASYILQVITHVSWPCPITYSCSDTTYFVLNGGLGPNDSVIVYYPNDTTSYFPGDTIPVPIDTFCLYGGVLVPAPDSSYDWWWYLYTSTGQPLDSGSTSLACLSISQPGTYPLVYGVLPVSNLRTRRYTFYLQAGGRSTTLHSPSLKPTIYPNPARDVVKVSLPYPASYQIEIWDPLGRLHYRAEIEGGKETTLNLNMPAGLYLMNVIGREEKFVLRLTVE